MNQQPGFENYIEIILRSRAPGFETYLQAAHLQGALGAGLGLMVRILSSLGTFNFSALSCVYLSFVTSLASLLQNQI